MKNRPDNYTDEHRRAVLAGMNAKALNEKLREACLERWSGKVAGQIIDAFKDKADIDREAIVNAAIFGLPGQLDALTRAIPCTKETQGFYDRALIAVAVDHFAPQARYLSAAKMLLDRGADPEAYDCAARQYADGYHDKGDIFRLIDDAIEAREQARREAERKAVPAARGPAPKL